MQTPQLLVVLELITDWQTVVTGVVEHTPEAPASFTVVVTAPPAPAPPTPTAPPVPVPPAPTAPAFATTPPAPTAVAILPAPPDIPALDDPSWRSSFPKNELQPAIVMTIQA